MTVQERIYQHLQNIAPRAVSNREIGHDLQIPWPGTVYNATRTLLNRGLIVGERRGREWVFSALPSPPFRPVESFGWNTSADARSFQVHWLAPVLATPQGRAWFLERLRCPTSTQAAHDGQVSHFCHPLHNLFQQDLAACQGDRQQEDRLIAYYNDLFGLPADCGIEQVWRSPRKGRLRLPYQRGAWGWTDKLLRKHIAVDRYRRRARRVGALMRAEVDALLLTEYHVVLVTCLHAQTLSEQSHALQRRLAGVLEHRMGRMFHLGAVVDHRDQLGIVHLPYILWEDVQSWHRDHLAPPVESA
ncbi:MAG: hypothetical protein GX552_14460 [Chloroflexi bacterium]|nr:hypothetical protein [Chloroflexota bacterium]